MNTCTWASCSAPTYSSTNGNSTTLSCSGTYNNVYITYSGGSATPASGTTISGTNSISQAYTTMSASTTYTFNCYPINALSYQTPTASSANILTGLFGDSISNLVTYVTFDATYNSNGSAAWTSGSYYWANIATGTPTNMYKALNNSFAYPGGAQKWGANSLYCDRNAARNTDSYTFPGNTGLSWTMWINIVKQNTYTCSSIFCYETAADTNATQIVAFRVTSLTGTPNPPFYMNFIADNTTGAGYSSGGTNLTSTPIPTNTWTHVAWTISPAGNGATNATHTFYVNGVQTQTVTGNYPQGYARVFNDLAAGSQNGENTGYYDTFRFYTRTLSANDITYIYNTADPSNIK